MLAPTRELVAELNRRARDHRLDHSPTSAEVRLADGNRASVGDVVITRRNDRRLRLTATDWVKNGDRWTFTQVSKHGDLTVRHTRRRLAVRLPADYVRESTGLGYATTVHAAQGVTADAMHGLLTGRESRQQLYTMLLGCSRPFSATPTGSMSRPSSWLAPDRSGPRRPSRPDRPRTHQRTIVADPQSTSARFGG
jgi:hypothetical protein